MSEDLVALIAGISILLFFIIMIFIVSGIVVGYTVVNQKTHSHLEDIELKYHLYTRKWLKSLKRFNYFLTTSTGIRLKLYITVPKAKATDKIVICHHGVCCTHVVWYKHTKYYLKNGFTVISYDSRGWGIHGGSPYKCTFGFHEKDDLLSVVKFVHKHLKPKQVILHGESMGGNTVLQYACHFDHLNLVHKYIEDSGYVTFSACIKSNLKRLFPAIPYWLVLPFSNLYVHHKCDLSIIKNNIYNKLQNIQHPMLAIHSVVDGIVPYQELLKIQKKVPNLSVYTNVDSPHVLTILFHNRHYILTITDFINNDYV